MPCPNSVRRDYRAGLTNGSVMRKYGVGHLVVQSALGPAWLRPRKKPSPRPTRLDPCKPLVDRPGADEPGSQGGLDWSCCASTA